MPRKSKNPIDKVSSYMETRFNARKHGVLSKLQVLPWEDPKELEELRASFMEEYKPQGPTETHLTHELANLIFRKQRLYAAEAAITMSQLQAIHIPQLAREAAVYSETATPCEDQIDLKDILYQSSTLTNDTIKVNQDLITYYQDIIESDLVYEEMVDKMHDDIQEAWEDCLNGTELSRDPISTILGYQKKEKPIYESNKECLVKFIEVRVIQSFKDQIVTLKAAPYIKQQAIGLAHIPQEKQAILLKYEIKMDRRFEKLLSMLLKMQERRGVSNNIMTLN